MFLALHTFLQIGEQIINKQNEYRPNGDIQYKLAHQDFSPVAENMGMNNDEAVINLIIFHRRSE
jgi:hypothetical protein